MLTMRKRCLLKILEVVGKKISLDLALSNCWGEEHCYTSFGEEDSGLEAEAVVVEVAEVALDEVDEEGSS